MRSNEVDKIVFIMFHNVINSLLTELLHISLSGPEPAQGQGGGEENRLILMGILCFCWLQTESLPTIFGFTY